MNTPRLMQHDCGITIPLAKAADKRMLELLPPTLMALLETLPEEAHLRIILGRDAAHDSEPCMHLAIHGTAEQDMPALAEELGVLTYDIIGVRQSMQESLPEVDGDAWPHSLTLQPRLTMQAPLPPAPRLVETATAPAASTTARSSEEALFTPAHVVLAVNMLARQPGRSAIVFDMGRSTLSAAEQRGFNKHLKALEQQLTERFPLPDEATRRTIEALQEMLSANQGFWMRCTILGEHPIPAPVARHLCHGLFGAPHNPAHGKRTRLLWPRLMFTSLAILPAIACVPVWGNEARRPLPPLPESILLGTDMREHARHLSLRDRLRHTYLIGVTGTGKSTLMLNMALQDMEAGRSVVLFDPHGDLWEQMRRVVPASRREDVQLCHLSDPRWSFRLNMLGGLLGGGSTDISMVINTLYDLFRKVLYKDVPEAFGPIFESLFRNALLLILLADHPELTLYHLQRVFTDRKFREWLLDIVQNKHLDDFWRRIFPRLSGDWNAENLTFYVTSKFAMLLQNPLLEPVLTATRSTLSFQQVLGEQRICLINLAKGDVGARNASFVAGLLSLRLGMAAMAQARRPEEQRLGACVYMDEFHNYASHILADMLAETRKYGLALTLAHQTLAQIDGQRAIDDIRHDVLANTANKLIFRIGHQDAHMLEHFVAPHFDERELSALDDHHMVALTMEAGRARQPALVRTPAPPALREPNDPPLPQPPVNDNERRELPPIPEWEEKEEDDDDFIFRRLRF